MANTNPYFRPNQPRLLRVERAISSCLETYLVTLTTKRRLSSNTFSNDVRETFNRVNGKLFGTAFKRGRNGEKVRLRSLAVQELTANDGLHTHLLVGVPDDSLDLRATPCPIPVPDLIIQTWIAGDPHFRRREAQDVRPITDFEGARSYIMKDIYTLADFAERLDPNNTH